MITPTLAQLFDKEMLDVMMKSAGAGAAVGWIIQFYMWREERAERLKSQEFILAMLEKTITEKVNGTNAITALTTAVNAVLAVVKDTVK